MESHFEENKKKIRIVQNKQILLAGVIVFFSVCALASFSTSRLTLSQKQIATSNAAGFTPATQQYAFGTLISDPVHSQQEAAAGVNTAMLEFSWKDYEPQDGVFNTSYINNIRQSIQTYQSSGQHITLALGLHYVPSWIFNYANSNFVNQYGVSGNEVNLVFNQTVRLKAQQYIQHIITDLGINNFSNIRITSGGDAELMYPPMSDSQNHSNSYWAYDTNAQTGANLPPTVSINPFPGWQPGQTTYNGQAFTTSQVDQWYMWYIRSVDDEANWQIQLFKNAGYTGSFQILSPGLGTRPSQYTQAINGYLNGAGDGAHTMGRAAVWDKIYSNLPDKLNVIAYVSSMADGSGNNDLCQSTDITVNITDPQINNWSATRWISYIADRNNLGKSGENPGRSDTNNYGVQMMNTTANQMSSCHFSGMYWAHDYNLYDGVSGVTLSDYQNIISQYNPNVSTMPTPSIVSPSPTQGVSPTQTPTPSPTVIPDTTPPTVSITFPLNGATVNRNRVVTIQATATDNNAVTKVEFYVNNILKCTDVTFSYTCNWSVPAKPDVNYTLKAVAYDAANNVGTNTVLVVSH